MSGRRWAGSDGRPTKRGRAESPAPGRDSTSCRGAGTDQVAKEGIDRGAWFAFPPSGGRASMPATWALAWSHLGVGSDAVNAGAAGQVPGCAMQSLGLSRDDRARFCSCTPTLDISRGTTSSTETHTSAQFVRWLHRRSVGAAARDTPRDPIPGGVKPARGRG